MNRLRTAAAATGLIVLGGFLSGCGVAQSNQTYKARTPYDASNASLGTLQIRNLHVEAPAEGAVIEAGATARILGTFVNDGRTDDRLVGATTTAAATLTLEIGGVAADGLPIPAGGRSADDAALVLTGVTEELRPGTYVSVMLDFATAGRLTVSIPVRAGDNGLAERERLHVEEGGE